MKNLSLSVDLSSKTEALEVIHSIQKSLGMPLSILGSWDAFYDNLRSLDTESEVIKREKPDSLHLILKNIGDFEHECRNRNSSEFNTLVNILARATDKKQRYDGIDFTFEIANN